MLSSLAWLTLEVKYLDRAVEFYTSHLDLPVRLRDEKAAVLEAGDTAIRLHAPGRLPRGGVHTHYAYSTPHDEYGAWWDRLSESFELTEYEFSTSKSLYFYDPDGHCVEIGQRPGGGSGITGVFEVVLEVEDLHRAEAFYTSLGPVTSRGTDRARVRLDLGPVDLELWEPQLGIADAQGGVHVELGFTTPSPGRVGEQLCEKACTVDTDETRVVVRDPDGHTLTFERPD